MTLRRTAEERWTSIGLKPYFNDLVVHKGHAFGFDGELAVRSALFGSVRDESSPNQPCGASLLKDKLKLLM